jgi:hypothetical protein
MTSRRGASGIRSLSEPFRSPWRVLHNLSGTLSGPSNRSPDGSGSLLSDQEAVWSRHRVSHKRLEIQFEGLEFDFEWLELKLLRLVFDFGRLEL